MNNNKRQRQDSTESDKEYLYSPSLIDPLGNTEKIDILKNGSKLVSGDKVNLNSKYNLTIMNKLGSGGFGDVHKCKDTIGNEYAIKQIRTDSGRGIPCLFEASMM